MRRVKGHLLIFFLKQPFSLFPELLLSDNRVGTPLSLTKNTPFITLEGYFYLDGLISLDANCSQIQMWSFLFAKYRAAEIQLFPSHKCQVKQSSKVKWHHQKSHSWFYFNLTQSHQPPKWKKSDTDNTCSLANKSVPILSFKEEKKNRRHVMLNLIRHLISVVSLLNKANPSFPFWLQFI